MVVEGGGGGNDDGGNGRDDDRSNNNDDNNNDEREERKPIEFEIPDVVELFKKKAKKVRASVKGGGGGGGGSGGGSGEDLLKDLKKKIPAIGLIAVVGIILIIILGAFYTIAPEEIGVVKRFGKVVRTTDPGPHLKIPFIEHVLKPQVTKVHRMEVGFETIDPGPPARYRSIAKESLMLTGDENIIAVEFIVQFKISDPTAFLFNIRRPGKAIKDASEAAMREVVGKTMISSILTEGRFQVQQETKQLLQRILDSYDSGLSVVAVQLQDVLPPDQVADAFKDVASAREDRERAVEQAEGYRNDLIPKAKGYAEKIINEAQAYKEAKVNEAKGDTSRFLQVLKEYRKAKDVTQKRIYIETMEEVLSRMDKIIMEGAAAKNVLPYLPLRSERPANKGRTNQ
ncbi:HflK protein [hydrothermal vent metagenome]|uniref:HflK protein n=1 Tax=hydrothermal vent metagenome TaxID=652676 RepID=A0A3B0R671_9ZZZZ